MGDVQPRQPVDHVPCQRLSLVDKGKPDASRGRKATGPTRSAELPNRKKLIMRKITRISGIVAVVGIMFAAGLAPASADTVNSTVSGGSLTVTTSAPTLSAVTLNGSSTQTSIGDAPTAWSITDARGTGAAWAVSVTAVDFTRAIGDTDLTIRTIPMANLTITPGAIAAGTGATSAASITTSAQTMSLTSKSLVSTTGPNLSLIHISEPTRR